MNAGYIRKIKKGGIEVEREMDSTLKRAAQQKALIEIAARLGVVCYRPNDRSQPGDKNAVLFYTKEDAEHNRMVAQGPVKYSWAEAAERMRAHEESIPACHIFKDCFWHFENSDGTGAENLDWANSGTVDLRADRWKEILEGHIRLAFANKRQLDHIYATGGFYALREADETYNDLNREMIEAMRMIHGTLYLGDVNYFDQRKERVVAGESIYEAYTGQPIYNFGCCFCVPDADAVLQELIREWNASDTLPKKAVEVDRITQRIEEIGGLNFIWF